MPIINLYFFSFCLVSNTGIYFHVTVNSVFYFFASVRTILKEHSMPLLFDMPLEQCNAYKGINPRPSDFDAYWERALAEMRNTNPDVEIRKAGFTSSFAECSDMFFTGVGGARIHARLVRPSKHAGKCPAVIMFHGYSGNSGEWLDKLAWAGEGFVVAALDCRGQGGLSEDSGCPKGWTLNGHIVRGLGDSPEKLLYRSIFLDTAQLAGIVMNMPDVDADRVGATGGSQGGGLTLACASLEPRIKRAAPVYPFLSDYRRVWDIDLAKDAYNELRDWFRRFDPRHEREDAVFNQLGYIDVQHLCSGIRAEVLMGVGFMDTICPPSTQFAAYNKIRSKKSLITYPDFGHEDLPDLNDAIFQFFRGM
jgi:cephalosporin-C deacetylase